MHSHNHPVISRVAFFCLFYFLFTPFLRGGHIVTLLNANGRRVYVNTASTPSIPGDGATIRQSDPAFGSTSSPARRNLQRLVRHTAGKFRVDPKLVDAMIKVESQYNPRAVSSKGAMGLMQLIPATAERFGVQNPFDPEQNVQGGVGYLRYLLNLFNGNLRLSLAAYNAGEHSVLRYGNVPEIPETVNYVRKVTALYRSQGNSAGTPAPVPADQEAPIYRYVDGQGVMHFTNDGGY